MTMTLTFYCNYSSDSDQTKQNIILMGIYINVDIIYINNIIKSQTSLVKANPSFSFIIIPQTRLK